MVLVLTSACGDDDGGGVDAATGDASTDGGSDAGSTFDAGSTADAGSAEDAGSTDDAGLADAGEDATSQDAGSDADVDAGDGCDYVAVDEVVVRCDGTFTFVNHFTSTVDGCDDFYAFTPDGPRYEDYASVIASNPACDAGCQYRFSTSVSRIYCERRTGYEILRAEGCDDAYRFPEGYYASVEEHDAAHPCE
ncbi:MAG: hypothetical protein R3B99_13715 [Polyangiales bacterium]